MFLVAAATAAGWLLLFFVLLVIPPREEGATAEPAPGAEPPAVVSVLARRLDRDGFGVTLADLAARGWFRLSGAPGPADPVMCVVPAKTPAGVRATAWDLLIPAEAWRRLPPGTFAHARVNLHNREVTIHPVEPPAVARPLADVAAEQERAITGSLPNPEQP